MKSKVNPYPNTASIAAIASFIWPNRNSSWHKPAGAAVVDMEGWAIWQAFPHVAMIRVISDDCQQVNLPDISKADRPQRQFKTHHPNPSLPEATRRRYEANPRLPPRTPPTHPNRPSTQPPPNPLTPGQPQGIAPCLLPLAPCLLPLASCLLPLASCPLPLASCLPPPP